MKIDNLTLTNFNGREFNITYYSLQDNPQLLLIEQISMMLVQIFLYLIIIRSFLLI